MIQNLSSIIPVLKMNLHKYFECPHTNVEGTLAKISNADVRNESF